MTKFCDVQKFKSAYEHRVGVQFDNAIHEMEKEEFLEDVVEQKKIDKALDEVYKIRNEILQANGCYEPNDVIDIIDEISKLIEEI